MRSLPRDKVEQYAEEIAFQLPPWFFELYTEWKGEPFQLEDYQIRYMMDDSVFKITNKCRQAGGSLMMAMMKMYRAYRIPGFKANIVSINLREAMDKISLIRKIHDSLPPRYRIPLTTDNKTSIGFHKGANQSIIEAIASSAAVRGGMKEMVFDEFAHIPMAEELFTAGAPAMINGDLTLELISTPKGNQDMFSKVWRNERDEEGDYPFAMFSRHQFIWCDVRRFVTDYEGAQQRWYVDYQEDMTRMRELVQEFGSPKLRFFYHLYPWSQFQQEFCGVFLDESSAFFPNSLIQSCLRPPYAKVETDTGVLEEKEFLDPWEKRPYENNNRVYMGIDYGESEKSTDKTSIQILEQLPNGRLMHRYSKVLSADNYPTFPDQARFIAEVYDAFRPTKVLADDTGLGRGINPFLRELRPDMALEEVNFNIQSKEKMVMNLKTRMEKGTIWLLQDDLQLHGQIRNIERKLSIHEKAQYSGKPYDDMFWALALAASGGQYSRFGIYVLGQGSVSDMQSDRIMGGIHA